MLPDVEQMARTFILGFVSGVPVATKISNPRPAEYVWVRRTGGASANRILDRAYVTVTCKAASMVRAKEIASPIREAFLGGSTGMPLVRAVTELTGPYQDPDPDTGEDRVTFTIALTVRAKR